MSDEYGNQDSSTNNESSGSAPQVFGKKSNHKLLSIVVGLLIAGALVMGFLSFHKSTEPEGSVATKTVSVAKVSITKDGFVPANLQITKGTSVAWTNNDKVRRTLVVTDDAKRTTTETETLAPGESFSMTVTDAKTYHFDSPASGVTFQGILMVKGEESSNE